MSNFADRKEKEERKHEANMEMGKFYLDVSKFMFTTMSVANLATSYLSGTFDEEHVIISIGSVFVSLCFWWHGRSLIRRI